MTTPDSRGPELPSELLLPAGLAPTGAATSVETTSEPGGSAPRSWSDVPWRTILGTIGAIAAALALFAVLYIAWTMVVLVAVAGFFAVVLAPPVRAAERRLHLRRGAAVGLVILLVIVILGGLITLFLLPVRTQLIQVITDLPGTVRQASTGRGPLGDIVQKLQLEELVAENQASLTKAAESMQMSVPDMIGWAVQILLAIITVLVMTTLMLTQSGSLAKTASRLVPDRHRATVVQVSREAAKAVSGYMIGNLIISLCAGVTALSFLLIVGVPSAIVVALWVAFADLIPLVGATLGAIVAVIASLSVSPGAGIAAIVFFLLYQQFENSVLQLMVMARTVQVNPLAVLLSVLIGVELWGLLGALLAIPIAGAISVVVKELWRHRASELDRLVLVSERGIPLLPEPPTDAASGV